LWGVAARLLMQEGEMPLVQQPGEAARPPQRRLMCLGEAAMGCRQ